MVSMLATREERSEGREDVAHSVLLLLDNEEKESIKRPLCVE